MANIHFDWRLRSGIASTINLCVLLGVLASFPLVLRWTGALGVAEVNPDSPLHTWAFLRACFVLVAFLWICFGVALVGIQQRRCITWREVVGARWSSAGAVIRDLGVACLTLVGMAVIGNLSNMLLHASEHDVRVFRAMVAPQNGVEALAFLAAALTAGFVEEFVFRGYLQRQCQALFGSTILASVVQVLIFTQGHFYQGWRRLVPVFLIGALLTVVALWRKSLLPGMMAHAIGDSLVTIAYFAKHL